MYSKHKDASPEETVKKIIALYSDIDLTPECHIEKHIDGIFSAYLIDPKGKWNVAGKGTTEAFCLASAYGESIEHICNHFAFDISRTDKAAKEHCGFYRYSDEELHPISDIRNISPIVYDDMKEAYLILSSGRLDEDDLNGVWEKLLGSAQTPFVPYFHVNNGNVEFLPDAVISKLCGSNGGGSGNTPEEAIGHALDEIIERYAKHRIIYDKLTPPVIPKEYIAARVPELSKLIDDIERKGKLSVSVMDASLGEGYTVICVSVIDAQVQRYLVNFGAHPCFEIALERCLTELFQDHECVEDLINRSDMMTWCNISEDKIYGLNNWVSLLRDDIGYLPDSFFGGRPS